MDLLKKIKSNAKKYGLDKDYFFTTTLERYEEQLKILEELKNELDTSGMLVKKSYVKNRENVYSNPAISDYNKTTDSANKTAMALLKMIDRAKKETNASLKTKAKKDPLAALLGD